MADSIRKRITDQLLARLGGDTVTPMPTGLGTVKITKNRTSPISSSDLPSYSVYFLHNMPKPIGDPRRAVVNQNHLTIEVRIIANGNDDALDAHDQWVILRMGTADRLPQSDGSHLTLGIVEGETFFESLEGSQEERTVHRIQWVVEFQSLRADMTKSQWEVLPK